MSGWASLANVLDAGVIGAFGREITYTPQGGDAVVVRAILEVAQRREETSPGVHAVLFLRLADLPQAPARGDEVQISESAFSVFEIEADSEGGARLGLHRR